MPVFFLQVIWKNFYSTKSAGEHGTLFFQLRNLIHRTNVVADPVKDFNACDDFVILVVTCHILTAALKVLGMDSLNDTSCLPLYQAEPQNLWMLSDLERKEILNSTTEKIVVSSHSTQVFTSLPIVYMSMAANF